MKTSTSLRLAILGLSLILGTTACKQDPQVKKAKFIEKGKLNLAQHKYPEARLQFESAIKIDRKAIDVYLLLAQVHVYMHDYNHAYQALEQIIKIDPDNFEANRDLSGLLMNLGQFKQARVAARKALAVKPNDPKANEYMAYIYQGLGDFKSMEKGLESVLAADPSQPIATLTLLKLKVREKDMEGIQEILERAAEKATDSGTHTILGNYYLLADKMPEAEKEYRKAMQIDPKSVPAAFALARFFEANKKLPEAEAVYRRVAAEHDDDLTARGATANMFIEHGETDKAVTELQGILKRHPDDEQNRTQLLTALWRAGRIDQTVALANEILKKNSKDNKALMVLAIINQEAGKTQEAMSQFQTVLHFQPNNSTAHYFMGKCYEQRGQLGPAKQEVEDAVKAAPTNIAARLYLAELLVKTGGATAAVEVLKSAPAPQNLLPNVRLEIVKAQVQKGDLSPAAVELTTLNKINPHLPGLQTEIGVVLGGLGKFPDAQLAFKRGLIDDRQDLRAITGLATTYMAMKQSAAGEKVFEDMAKAIPENGAIQMSLSRLRIEQGKTDLAIKEMNAYLAKFPNDLGVTDFLAQAHRAKGDLPGAEAAYRKITQTNPSDSEAHYHLGLILEAMNRNPEAIQEYKVAVGLNSENLSATNNLAWLLAETGGNIDDALKLAQKAKEKYPNSPAFSDTLGWVLIKKNNPTAALQQFTEATQGDPKNPEFQYHLGYAYWRSGDANKAEKALQTSLSTKVDFKASQDAKTLLREVQAKLRR